MTSLDEMIAEVRADLFEYADYAAPELHEVPGLVQMWLTMWIPGRGWLTTRRGIVVCNLTGGRLVLTDEEMITLEAKSGYRAIMHTLKKENINPDGRQSRAPEEGREGPDRDQGDADPGQDR